MNAKETLELISKQWCSLNDLIKLTGLGKNNASKLKNEIRIDLYKLPAKLLPMNEVAKQIIYKNYKYDVQEILDKKDISIISFFRLLTKS